MRWIFFGLLIVSGAASAQTDLRLSVGPTVDHVQTQIGQHAGGGASAFFDLEADVLYLGVEAGFRLWHVYQHNGLRDHEEATGFGAGFDGRFRLALNTGRPATHSFEATLIDTSILTIPNAGTTFQLSQQTRFSWLIDLPQVMADLFVGYRFDTRQLDYSSTLGDETSLHHGMIGVLMKFGRQQVGRHHELTRWWVVLGWRFETGVEGNDPSVRPFVVHLSTSIPVAFDGKIYVFGAFDGILRNRLPAIEYAPQPTDGLGLGPGHVAERKRWSHSVRVGVGFDVF